jgi:hypothetical protein
VRVAVVHFVRNLCIDDTCIFYSVTAYTNERILGGRYAGAIAPHVPASLRLLIDWLIDWLIADWSIGFIHIWLVDRRLVWFLDWLLVEAMRVRGEPRVKRPFTRACIATDDGANSTNQTSMTTLVCVLLFLCCTPPVFSLHYFYSVWRIYLYIILSVYYLFCVTHTLVFFCLCIISIPCDISISVYTVCVLFLLCDANQPTKPTNQPTHQPTNSRTSCLQHVQIQYIHTSCKQMEYHMGNPGK